MTEVYYWKAHDKWEQMTRSQELALKDAERKRAQTRNNTRRRDNLHTTLRDNRRHTLRPRKRDQSNTRSNRSRNNHRALQIHHVILSTVRSSTTRNAVRQRLC